MILGIYNSSKYNQFDIAKILLYFTIPPAERDVISIREFLESFDEIYNNYKFKKSEISIPSISDMTKELSCKILNKDIKHFNIHEFKTNLLDYYWDIWVVSIFDDSIKKVFRTKIDAEKWVKKHKIVNYNLYEKIYDYVGFSNHLNEVCNDAIHPDIWIYTLLNRYYPNDYIHAVSINNPDWGQLEIPIYPNWIIPDVKTIKEAELIRHGMLPDVWDIENDPADFRYLIKINNETPVTEDIFKWDYVINDIGNIEDLVEKIYIMLSLNPKFIRYFHI